MIDIHSHILPEFDDGAETLEVSIQMAEHAASGGTTVIFATPHISTSDRTDLTGKIADKAAMLQETLDSHGINVKIIPGAEVYLSPCILKALDKGKPITLGISKYILIDMPSRVMPTELENLMLGLEARGITPILAHPERNMLVQQDPGILEPMVKRGMLIQTNASSILGGHGKAAAATALTLLRHRWVQFLASDSHSAQNRLPRLVMAARALIHSFGANVVSDLVENNGRRLMTGEVIPANPADYCCSTKRSWFSWFIRARKPALHSKG